MKERKIHKRDPHPDFARAMCGAKVKGPEQLSAANAAVTCKTCRGWFPVGERAVPSR
jgi:hypothetical protein